LEHFVAPAPSAAPEIHAAAPEIHAATPEMHAAESHGANVHMHAGRGRPERSDNVAPPAPSATSEVYVAQSHSAHARGFTYPTPLASIGSENPSCFTSSSATEEASDVHGSLEHSRRLPRPQPVKLYPYSPFSGPHACLASPSTPSPRYYAECSGRERSKARPGAEARSHSTAALVWRLRKEAEAEALFWKLLEDSERKRRLAATVIADRLGFDSPSGLRVHWCRSRRRCNARTLRMGGEVTGSGHRRHRSHGHYREFVEEEDGHRRHRGDYSMFSDSGVRRRRAGFTQPWKSGNLMDMTAQQAEAFCIPRHSRSRGRGAAEGSWGKRCASLGRSCLLPCMSVPRTGGWERLNDDEPLMAASVRSASVDESAFSGSQVFMRYSAHGAPVLRGSSYHREKLQASGAPQRRKGWEGRGHRSTLDEPRGGGKGLAASKCTVSAGPPVGGFGLGVCPETAWRGGEPGDSAADGAAGSAKGARSCPDSQCMQEGLGSEQGESDGDGLSSLPPRTQEAEATHAQQQPTSMPCSSAPASTGTRAPRANAVSAGEVASGAADEGGGSRATTDCVREFQPAEQVAAHWRRAPAGSMRETQVDDESSVEATLENRLSRPLEEEALTLLREEVEVKVLKGDPRGAGGRGDLHRSPKAATPQPEDGHVAHGKASKSKPREAGGKVHSPLSSQVGVGHAAHGNASTSGLRGAGRRGNLRLSLNVATSKPEEGHATRGKASKSNSREARGTAHSPLGTQAATPQLEKGSATYSKALTSKKGDAGGPVNSPRSPHAALTAPQDHVASATRRDDATVRSAAEAVVVTVRPRRASIHVGWCGRIFPKKCDGAHRHKSPRLGRGAEAGSGVLRKSYEKRFTSREQSSGSVSKLMGKPAGSRVTRESYAKPLAIEGRTSESILDGEGQARAGGTLLAWTANTAGQPDSVPAVAQTHTVVLQDQTKRTGTLATNSALAAAQSHAAVLQEQTKQTGTSAAFSNAKQGAEHTFCNSTLRPAKIRTLEKGGGQTAKEAAQRQTISQQLLSKVRHKQGQTPPGPSTLQTFKRSCSPLGAAGENHPPDTRAVGAVSTTQRANSFKSVLKGSPPDARAFVAMSEFKQGHTWTAPTALVDVKRSLSPLGNSGNSRQARTPDTRAIVATSAPKETVQRTALYDDNQAVHSGSLGFFGSGFSNQAGSGAAYAVTCKPFPFGASTTVLSDWPMPRGGAIRPPRNAATIRMHVNAPSRDSSAHYTDSPGVGTAEPPGAPPATAKEGGAEVRHGRQLLPRMLGFLRKGRKVHDAW
jgi:hypothetical protein